MADVKLLHAICFSSNFLPVKVTDIFSNLPVKFENYPYLTGTRIRFIPWFSSNFLKSTQFDDYFFFYKMVSITYDVTWDVKLSIMQVKKRIGVIFNTIYKEKVEMCFVIQIQTYGNLKVGNSLSGARSLFLHLMIKECSNISYLSIAYFLSADLVLR